MELTQKQKIGVVVIALVGAYGLGWWSSPAKVVTKSDTKQSSTQNTKTVNNTNSDTNDHKVVKTTETDEPNGTKVIQTVVTDDSDTKTSDKSTDSSKSSASSETQTSKTVTSEKGKINLSLMAGAQLNNLSGGMVYGIHADKRLIGPFTVGAFAFTNSTAGLSVGITF